MSEKVVSVVGALAIAAAGLWLFWLLWRGDVREQNRNVGRHTHHD